MNPIAVCHQLAEVRKAHEQFQEVLAQACAVSEALHDEHDPDTQAAFVDAVHEMTAAAAFQLVHSALGLPRGIDLVY